MLVQKCHPYTRKPNSETPANIKNRFLPCGYVFSLTALLGLGSVFCVWRIFANWLRSNAVQPFSPSFCCGVFKAVTDAGERAGPGLDAELMPPEQPSGSRWWNRLPGRGGGGGLGSRGGSQGDLQHGEAPLSAAQQARDRLSRYSRFFMFLSRVSPCMP